MEMLANNEMIRKVFVNYCDSLVEGYTHSVSRLGSWAIETTAEALFTPFGMGVAALPMKLAKRNRKYVHVLSTIDDPDWCTENTIVYQSDIAVLRDFSVNPQDKSVVPVLLVPPQAGQHSCIADYSPEQSQVRTIRNQGFNRIYAIEWLSANEETKTAGVEDYMNFMHECIRTIGEPANVIGDCQGGWQSTVFACLFPADVHSLTVAGGPIDFQAGSGDIKNYVNLVAESVGLDFYKWMVASQNGVMEGERMLKGFLALKPENAVTRFVDLYADVEDEELVDRFKTFESWFTYPQNLPGTFYLWIIENLFSKNRLIKGELELLGRTVDMKNITCPVYLLAGAKDHITPPIQVFEMANYIGTPADQVMKLTNSGGHTGLFMGRAALHDEWPVICQDMMKHSKRSGTENRIQ